MSGILPVARIEGKVTDKSHMGFLRLNMTHDNSAHIFVKFRFLRSSTEANGSCESNIKYLQLKAVKEWGSGTEKKASQEMLQYQAKCHEILAPSTG